MSDDLLQRKGRAFFLKDGTMHDPYGLADFHPASDVNRLEIFLEDGLEKSIIMVNFKATRKGLFVSHWFPLFFSGFQNKKLSGEQGFRTFARYWTLVPPQVTQWNANGKSPLSVETTVVQTSGSGLLGLFQDLTELETTHPASAELYEENKVAYVYDDLDVNNIKYGFYMVIRSGLEGFYFYSWVNIDDPQTQLEHIQVKPYNIFNITIQKGNLPKPETQISINQEFTNLILRAVAEMNANLLTLETKIGEDDDITKYTVKGHLNLLDNKIETEIEVDIQDLKDDKVDKTTKIADIEIGNGISSQSLADALVNDVRVATESLKGLMSSQDKQRLNTLTALLEDSESSYVDTLREILEIFEQYPEGDLIAQRFNDIRDELERLETEIDRVDKRILLNEVELTMEEYESLAEYRYDTLYFVEFIDEKEEKQIFLYRGETLISGGGGTGGGGGEVLPQMRIIPSPISRPTTFNLVVGEDSEFAFEYIHEEGAQATFYIYRNDALVQTRTINVGVHIINLKPYIFNGTNTLRLEVRDYNQTTRRIILNVQGIEITVSSTYQETTINSGDVLFPYKVDLVGSNSKVYFKINDDEPIVDNVTTPNNIQPLELDSGAYVLEFWATTEVDEVEIVSNKLRYIVLVDKGDYVGTMLISKFDTESISYGEKLTVDYIAYNPLNENITVLGYVNEVKKMEDEVIGGKINTFNVGVLEVGLHEIQLYADGKTLTYSVSVTESGVDIRNIDDVTLKTYLRALGKSNAGLDREEWLNSSTNGTTYPFIMSGFNYTSNGWLDDALVFNGKAKAELRYKPFENEIGISGKTIEFQFETPAISDGSNIIECFSDGLGFEIKSNKASLVGSNFRIDTNYSESTKLKVTFVISKTKSKVFLYLDGVLTNQANLSPNTRFKQDTPAFIKFNDTHQDLKVYNIRIYDRELEAAEVLNNDIFDENDIDKKFEEYNKTLIYDGGKVTPNKVKQIIPIMIISLSGALPQDANYRPATTEIRYENIFNENLNFTLNNVNIRTQGTSTLIYPIKNYRLYNGDLTNNPVTIDVNSRKAHIINLKADYVDSSVTTNSAIARLVEGMYSKGTRPMVEYPNLGARTTIYGSPVALFHNNNGVVSFVGLYSFNNDKSEATVYGHGIAPYEYSHRFEVTQNLGNSAGAFVKKDGMTEEEWWAELKADYESIYPKEVITNANYQQLREVIEFISDFDLDNIGSMTEQDISDFKDEFEERFDLEYVTKYFIMASVFGLLDSFGKNLQLNSWRDEEDENYYKWYLTFYDLDTAIGLDNEGRILDANGNPIYDYNIELESGEGFAQADSKLWKVFVALYEDEIKAVYQTMRANYLTDEKISNEFFGTQIDVIGKTIYNESNMFKYVLPSGAMIWSYILNGNRKLQIKSWMSNRLKFLDSKYVAGTNTTDKMIAFRMSFEAGDYPKLEITPHFHQYATVQFGNPNVEGNIVSERTDAYVPVEVQFKRNVGAEFLECRIYSADNIAEVKGFTDFDVDSIDFQYATNILRIDLSKGTPYNKLTNLSFGDNILLKELNLENLSGLDSSLDIKKLSNLLTLNIKGTNLLNIELPNGGALEEAHLNGTLTSLILKNLTYLETLTLENGDDVKEVTIENTPINLLELIEGMPNLTHLRVRDYNYSTNDKNFVLDLISAIYDSDLEVYKYGAIKSDGSLSTDINDLRQMVRGEIRLQVAEGFSEEEWELINKVLPFVEVSVTDLSLAEDFDLIDVGDFYEIEKYNGNSNNVVLPLGYNELLDVEEDYFFFGFEGWKLVKGIGDGAFRDNASIRTIDFGDNIEYIGNNAFRQTQISFDELPSSITKIGDYAFYGHRMNELYLDTTLLEVGANAFYGTNTNALMLVGHATRPSLWAENWTNSNNILYNRKLFVRTFNIDGVEYQKGYFIKSLPILTKDGYTFDKFTYQGVEIELPFVPTNEMPSVINIVSHWNLIPYTITYNGIDANVDNTDNPLTFTIEDLPITLEKPLGEPSGQEGNIWDGWFTASSGGTQVNQITTIGNKVVYGRWSPLSFKNATPAQLLDFVNQGLASALPVGETQTITLLDDDETQIELRLVDNTGSIIKRENGSYAGLVIEFRHIYKNAQMNATNTNAGGWNASAMRTVVMDEIWGYMPLEWKAVISKAQVQTMNGGNQAGTTLVTSLDYLWLPAQKEIFGTTVSFHEDEGNALTWFKYYADNNTNSARIKQLSGSNAIWWLRSADSYLSSYFVRVHTNGTVDTSNAGNSSGVSPCFII